MTAPYQRFCIVFAGTLGLSVLLTCAFSLTTDPQGVFPATALERLEPHRDHRTRIAKAARIARGGIDVLLVGTSRVEAGFDPAEPAWGQGVVYNAGLGGGNNFETLCAVDLALRTGRLGTLVICLDLFGMRKDLRGTRSFGRSLLDPSLSPLDYWAGNLIGRYGVERGWKVVRKASKDRRGSNRSDGLRIGGEPATALDHRRLFAGTIHSFYTDRYHEAYAYDAGLIERLGVLLRRARAQGARVIVVVPPIHALLFETLHRSGLGATYERFLRDLAERAAEANRLQSPGPPVAAWAFPGWTGRLTEALPAEGSGGSMEWWVEASHGSTRLGSELIKRIMDRPDADPGFGVRLEPGTLDAHLSRQPAAREAYAREHVDDLRWLEQVLADAQPMRDEASARVTALNARRR